ncbi:aromatic acid exporter family protein [Paenibacillus sp. P96]|uniref:Aromatic acid exporter family protein n=1 Tax=Paenibacillus zeirhizosphaerae TaxID=2987519 RepID=A0ABT9FSG5_9BACL|nr:aromatic acid exporter family protein [Paenibacillus sp. P96]MDP4097614.1 aromatic acid exporter family protein [Paenibacillus sp. P96]
MAFGARVLKTGIAVTLALFLSSLLNTQSPVGAAIAAIFAMQPSIYRSWRYFLDQLQTSTLGAIVALVGGMVLGNQPIAVGLICSLVIIICLQLKMADTIGLTLVTVVSVIETAGDWQFALSRFLLTLIGIVSAFLINILVFPPKPKKQFIGQIQSVFNRMSLLLRTAISDEIKETVFREEKSSLEGSIKGLSDKYHLFEEEQKKLKRARYSQTREMVVYKQMLTSLAKGFEVLDAVERHYFQAERPDGTDRFFDHHLEQLIRFHEHALLKFEDKLKPNDDESHIFEEENRIFMESAIARYDRTQEGVLRLAIVAAAMYDYGHQLSRLSRLADHIHRGDDGKDQGEGLMAWLRRS